MRRQFISLIVTLAMSIIGFTACSNEASEGSVTTEPTNPTASVAYTCAMHPEVISDRPGDCPKCGMALVKKTETPKRVIDTSAVDQHDSTTGQ